MNETMISAIVVGEPAGAQVAADALRASGIRVLGVVEEEDGLGRALALAPDVVAISVKRGAEMAAYHTGHEAATSGVVALFVVPALGTPVAESLMNAVPGSIAVALPLSPSEIRARVADALAARRSGCAVRP
ncbi:MAG: hypothetical protein J0H79_00065 [Alphaproteobacteria bacterium]|nr:hypothetical protein [Alphaproteobacteria bacterium]